MASVVFYEKPGCVNNTRQKALLAAAGHSVSARNLLGEAWTAEKLRPFFGALPVAEWFNRAAPQIKSGDVDPRRLTETEALLMMLADPLLIRRPLLQLVRGPDSEYRAGFEPEEIDAWIGLAGAPRNEDMESCPRSHATGPCLTPESA